MKNQFILIVVFSILTVGACQYEKEEMTETETPQICEQISYATQVQPIIETNCLACHNGGQYPDLRTYELIKQNATIVKQVVTTRFMPIGKTLSDGEISIIECWIEQGALQN